MGTIPAQKFIMFGGARIGCDPEAFFEKDGEIIESSKILGPDGIVVTDTEGFDRSRVVCDGVQLEIQPLAAHCRANVGNFIQRVLQDLREELKKHPGVTVKFHRSVELSEETFKSLSEESRLLGCMPSFNLYKPRDLGVDPATYRKRSCGGHIHLGDLAFKTKEGDKPTDWAKKLVRVLDVLVGNTMVLIDRDFGNIVRRKVYGRAGEYRLPDHGLEYRTLSNFWMHAYPLQSLVFALARQSVSVVYTTQQWDEAKKSLFTPYGFDAVEDLLSRVDMKKIVRAINKNDLDLAKENFEGYKSFFSDYFCVGEGLTSQTLDNFEYFAAKVQEFGLEFWWADDPFTHWCNKAEGHGAGWEAFCKNTVGPARLKP